MSKDAKNILLKVLSRDFANVFEAQISGQDVFPPRSNTFAEIKEELQNYSSSEKFTQNMFDEILEELEAIIASRFCEWQEKYGPPKKRPPSEKKREVSRKKSPKKNNSDIGVDSSPKMNKEKSKKKKVRIWIWGLFSKEK